MPDNDMGDPKDITNKTFEDAAKVAGQSPEEAKQNTLELLQKNARRKTTSEGAESAKAAPEPASSRAQW
jgi:hypothetical protein